MKIAYAVYGASGFGKEVIPLLKAQIAKIGDTKDNDYIAVGLPVLNNYPGWLANMIEKHSGGFAIPADDFNAYADALELAADNRNKLSEMGKNNQLLAEQFDRKILSSQFVTWLETNA